MSFTEYNILNMQLFMICLAWNTPGSGCTAVLALMDVSECTNHKARNTNFINLRQHDEAHANLLCQFLVSEQLWDSSEKCICSPAKTEREDQTFGCIHGPVFPSIDQAFNSVETMLLSVLIDKLFMMIFPSHIISNDLPGCKLYSSLLKINSFPHAPMKFMVALPTSQSTTLVDLQQGFIRCLFGKSTRRYFFILYFAQNWYNFLSLGLSWWFLVLWGWYYHE